MRLLLLIGVGVVVFLSPACQSTDGAEERPEAAVPPEVEPEARAQTADEQPTIPVELRRAVEQNPDSAVAHRQLGIALHQVGRRREALTHFERAVELQPDDRHRLDLALGYNSVGRPEDAEMIYRQILAGNPNHPIALHNLGNLMLTRGDIDDAIEQYELAIQAKPDYLLAHAHLADALKQATRNLEAYRAYEAVLGLDPSNAVELEAYDDALYGLAIIDLEMGAVQRAADFLAELLQAVPDHPNGHYAYGRALTMLGRQEEAQREFETHMRLLAEQDVKGPVATRD
jgi:tetratricopeptide (TPR) repeat protein